MDPSAGIKVGQLMTRKLVTVTMDDSLRKIRELFDAHKFHHLLVMDGSRLVGMISDRDLLRHISPFVDNAFAERSQDLATLNKRAHQIMTHKLIVVGPETPLGDAIALVLGNRISCLPVIDEANKPIGIVTWRDLLRCVPAAA